jgi:hypothetical protein
MLKHILIGVAITLVTITVVARVQPLRAAVGL